MKKFKSHKVVEAAKIKAVDYGNEKIRVALDDGSVEVVEFSDRFRISEEDLGYLVRYPDGYVSWSPTKAFEEGYTETDVSVPVHQGLPVAGYRPQMAEKVNIVNENKILEERALRQIDALKRENAVAMSNDQMPPYDGRMLALAFTGIQDAFMWMNRAVFQPDRVALPEDADK